MNILHILSSPASGGAEVYVKDLAKYMSQKGHTLHIAFVSRAEDVGRDSDYSNDFLNDLHSSGIETYFIGHKCRKRPLLGALRIRKYVLDNDIDIYHTHLPYGIIYSSLIKVPVIYTHHMSTPRFGKSIYNIFNYLVDEYIGISDICATGLTKYTGRNVVTIPNAVSIDKFNDHKRIRKADLDGRISIAMVGRLFPQKDYPNMIKAISMIPKDYLSKLEINIAGEGDPKYKKELIKSINNHNLSAVIKFRGNLSSVLQFLYEADLFLMSSENEGLPIALIEATISGLPCIVTDVGGCSEVINKSNSGVIVPPNDPTSIAKAIINFIDNPNLIENYSRNAFDSSHLYSIKAAAQKHLELYQTYEN